MDLFRHVDLESFHMQPKNHVSISAESLFLKLLRYHKAKRHRKFSSAFNIHVCIPQPKNVIENSGNGIRQPRFKSRHILAWGLGQIYSLSKLQCVKWVWSEDKMRMHLNTPWCTIRVQVFGE